MGDFLLGGGSLWAWVVRDWLSGGGPCRAPGVGLCRGLAGPHGEGRGVWGPHGRGLLWGRGCLGAVWGGA